jgi:hypothetical protein
MDWKLKQSDLKRYPHFDKDLKPAEIMAIVTDPLRVAQNKFFPLLQYKKKWQPFRGKSASSKPQPDPKDRPIRYAARRDAYIFTYYRHLLSEPYEAEIERLGISHCPVAYRRIPAKIGERGGKCNIHFAGEAFERIRELGNCCAIAVDISKFFESINHERLKSLWCRLLNVERLPDDHFAVFKNITQYHVVEREEAYKRLGFYGEKRCTKSGKSINGYLIPYKDVPTQLCTLHDFRQKILGKNGQYKSLVQPNEKISCGIPQGAAISDLLANLYLIDFDVEMNKLATGLGGTYIRYSDDILLILPISVDKAKNIMEEIPACICKYGEELIIKPSKSSLVQYRIDGASQAYELIVGKGKNGIEYLGFRYDGKNVYIRDATMSNLYRKVASIARNRAKATVKRYPGKDYAALCELFNFENFMKEFGRVENFEPTLDKKKWTFWMYVTRAVNELGPQGKKIHGQVKRLKKHCSYRINSEIKNALEQRDQAKLLASR